MVECTEFSTIKDFVLSLQTLAKEFLPGINFNMNSTPDGYHVSATSTNKEESEYSLKLLQDWISSWIGTSIKVKLKVIGMLYDNKTKVYNDSMIHRIWDNSRSSLIFFDIDQFKRINDTISYAKWDEILYEFAKILKREKSIFKKAEVIRNGGDEFLVIIEDADMRLLLTYIHRVQKLFDNVDGSHGTSYGYFFRKPISESTNFSKAYLLADKNMKSRKGREWKIYRIQQSIDSLSEDEKAELTQNLLWTLSKDQVEIILDSHKK